jgi:hypothetical protein
VVGFILPENGTEFGFKQHIPILSGGGNIALFYNLHNCAFFSFPEAALNMVRMA